MTDHLCTSHWRPIDQYQRPIEPGTRSFEKFGPTWYHRTDETVCRQGGGRVRIEIAPRPWPHNHHVAPSLCGDYEVRDISDD